MRVEHTDKEKQLIGLNVLEPISEMEAPEYLDMFVHPFLGDFVYMGEYSGWVETENHVFDLQG